MIQVRGIILATQPALREGLVARPATYDGSRAFA